MTRENKLALVIGFGLLLLAGIFVSDHLSAQQRTDEEPLVASEELVVPSPNILAARPAPAARAPAPTSGRRASSAPAASQPAPPVREIVIGQRKSTAIPSNLQVHYVARGETLTAIARKYYEDADQVKYIARHNNITDPNRVAVGTRLVIPKAPSSTPNVQAPQRRAAALSSPSPTPVTKKTITVRKGDTLGDISMRAFGTTKRWPEIAAINKDVLPDPDRLNPGMTLQLPSS